MKMVPVASIDHEHLMIPECRANMRIDMEWLDNKGACFKGKVWFKEKFPNDCTYLELRAALDNRAWERWLLSNVGGDFGVVGDNATLTGGDYSRLTGGVYSTLTGGSNSTLTSGYYSTLTGGDHSRLTGGYYSTLTGGHNSTLSIRYWCNKTKRYRIAIAYVGENGIEAGVAYKLDSEGKFIKA